MKQLLVFMLYACLCSSGIAVEATPLTNDPVLEARVMKLAEELRCLVCQNQTIADSHAGLAVDLKNQVRDQLRAGRSDKEVVDYMVQRYGDFVLYRPPVKASTWLLWGGPFLLLLGGLWLLLYTLKQRKLRMAQLPQRSMSPEQALQVKAALSNTAQGKDIT
jgi:cytochrome c-type biogenesis protein CcmH